VIYIKKKILYISVYLIFFLLTETKSYAAYPTLVSKLQSAFESIQSWLLALATPAAGISIATGAFMKKFSFGDEERMRTAKKVIRGSLVGYAVLLAIDLILAAIKSLIG
jgi:hypothetical protein